MKTLLWIVLAVVALVLIVRMILPRMTQSVAGGVVLRDGGDALADCPGTPNCQGSMSSDAGHRVGALPGRGSVSASLEAIEGVLAAMPGAHVVERNDRWLHATVTSRLVGYVDDIEFLVDENGKQVQVRSASRIGKSDLGANAKRIERLRDALAGGA